MNDSWTDYPISVIHWALQSLFGRLIVVVLVIALGCGFGVAFADRSISGFFVGLFMFPLIALPGLLVSVGLFVLPITLLFTCMFVIHEWPKWTLALPFVLNLWLAYDYMDYALYRSPDAKMRREMVAALEESAREEQRRAEKRRQHEAEEAAAED